MLFGSVALWRLCAGARAGDQVAGFEALAKRVALADCGRCLTEVVRHSVLALTCF